MDIEQLIRYFSLGVVVLRTVRQARAKGQSPWLWSGASILLMLVPGLQFLGIAPMVLLLFFRKSSQVAINIAEDRITCPKCLAYHATGHNFCVNCGWELDQPYVPEGTSQKSTTPEESPKIEQPGAAAPFASEVQSDVVLVIQKEAEADTPANVVALEQGTPNDLVEEEQVDPLPEEPLLEQPSIKPAFRFQLTAAGLTERGVSLVTQDRIQEAVDQFTKAIALDPAYRPAWAKRAEAYLRLGLSQKAEEDQHRLEGI